MALATIESKLYTCVTLMLLNGEIWKKSLWIFSIVIMFIQMIVTIGYVIRICIW